LRPWDYREENWMLGEISAAFQKGEILGPGVLALSESALPASPEALVARLPSAATVPHKIRNNLTAAAQS
jgi:hypothetical protein